MAVVGDASGVAALNLQPHVSAVSSGSRYSAAVLALTPSLYWRMNETTSTMTDSSGNARHGTVVGNPTRGATGALTNDTDKSVDLDGAGDYVHITTYNPWQNSTSRTFTGWFNRDGTGRDGLFGYAGGPLLEVASPSDPNTDDIVFAPDFDVTRSVWTHGWTPATSAWGFAALVFTQGGGANNLELFINGSSAGVKTNAGSFAGSRQFRAGTWNVGTMDFDGKMDEVAVFESALSSAQISNLYTIGTT